MKLSELAEETGELCGGDAEIRGLCTDSRVAGRGDAFFCFQGTRADGHTFAEEAVLRGALWGNKKFLPYCVIDLIEELTMIAAGALLVTHMTSVFDGNIFRPLASIRF